jgi:hypothetical protein
MERHILHSVALRKYIYEFVFENILYVAIYFNGDFLMQITIIEKEGTW